MIKLENVSTWRFLSYAKTLSSYNEGYKRVYNLLIQFGIKDYQMLKDLLDSDNKESIELRSILELELINVENKIKDANILGMEPEIFVFDDYNSSFVDDITLQKTDKLNGGDALLIVSPIGRRGAIGGQLQQMSIEMVKYLLSHLDSDTLNNALTIKRSFGIETVKKVVEKIQLYNEQVLRQASDVRENGINLFFANKSMKDKIVCEQLKDIVEYILDNASECVWGKLSDTQKLKMMSAVLPKRGECINMDKKCLIDVISNYTTLSELKQGVIKKKTLDRFIVR